MNTTRQLWHDGRHSVNCWMAGSSPVVAELMGQVGFDSLLFDMQHSATDMSDMLGIAQALSSSTSTMLVRVPSNEPSIIGKLLDMGVGGIVCPLVNTGTQARAFVEACRYPPHGVRSWGPFRAAFGLSQPDYFHTAHERFVTIAQIETMEALANLDEIARTPGLDALFVGPADMAISAGGPPTIDYTDPKAGEYHREIVRVAHAAGIKVGVLALVPEHVPVILEWGADMLSVTSDLGTILSVAGQDLQRARAVIAAHEDAAC